MDVDDGSQLPSLPMDEKGNHAGVIRNPFAGMTSALGGQKRAFSHDRRDSTEAPPAFKRAGPSFAAAQILPATPVHKRLAMDDAPTSAAGGMFLQHSALSDGSDTRGGTFTLTSNTNNFAFGSLGLPFDEQQPALPSLFRSQLAPPSNFSLQVQLPEQVGFVRPLFPPSLDQHSPDSANGGLFSRQRLRSLSHSSGSASNAAMMSPPTPHTPNGAVEPRFMRAASPLSKEAMKPDLRAFDQPLLPMDTNTRMTKQAPPAPQHARPYGVLMRKNSLYDTKTLFEFTHDAAHTSTKNLQVLGTVGEGSFFLVEK